MDPRCFDLPDRLSVCRLSRRRLLRGLGAGLAALLAARSLGASAAPPPIAPGVASTPEPISPGATDGVAKLRAFYLQGRLPVDPRQAEPGKGWRLFENGALSYLIPPAWSGRSLDALTDPTGVLIDVGGSRFAADDGSAAWETYLALAPGGATARPADPARPTARRRRPFGGARLARGRGANLRRCARWRRAGGRSRRRPCVAGQR